jgi:DNA-binding transcriptional ArsR family regulator
MAAKGSAASARGGSAARRLERGTPAADLKVVPGDETSVAITLDKVIHERIRLGIVSALAVNAHLSFNELKQLLHTTDGNVSVHARKLEDAGYVSSTKGFDGRVPRTEFRLTAAGRKALERYLAHMESLISAARKR